MLFAFIVLLGPLLFAEAIFRLLDLLGPPIPFSRVRDDRGVELVQYNLNSIKPRFTPEKVPGTLRVMIFGESTALGFPYHPRSSFGQMLKVMLEGSLPGLRVETINLARVGMNSYEVAALMPRALRYQPDLVIVYCGHNEFLSRSNPASLLNRLGRRAGNVRVARAAGLGLKLLAGAVALAVLTDLEEEPLAPPLPDRVSGRDFDHALDRYRQNLEAMAAACRKKGVPLVVNTLASNLAGWPPEERVFPRGISPEAREQAREAVARAKALAEELRAGGTDGGREEEVEKLLARAENAAPGYAPLIYWGAVLRLEDKGFATVLDERGSRLLARFKRALSEEAHTVTVHRAPPELNEVVRKTARDLGLWLVDNENSTLSLDENMFDDHCHPNLSGQVEIAKRIYLMLKDRGFPRPGPEWSPWSFDLPSYLKSRKLDAPFLHGLRLRLGVYLGLERDLPFRSELTRRQLNDAIAYGRDDPLPALLLAALHLHYGDDDDAAAALKPWRKKTDRLRLALDRYFTSAADLRDRALMFRIPTEPGLPPFRGLLTSGIVNEQKPRGRRVEPKPRSYYNAAIELR
jgi:lysophospholipase L1-like esterase